MRKPLLVLAVVCGMLLAPLTASAQSTVDLVVGTLDAFWAQAFADAGYSLSIAPDRGGRRPDEHPLR